ncbi:hypothetical protein GCM10009663_52720 [Kitasatospora arboriphila]|uniref:Transposase Helix-turn-helix domain-containing protein n=1 Tax=Kitasatospora arboriphila TaxID=258052 RepID=A0ABN1TUS2_9ACTN
MLELTNELVRDCGGDAPAQEAWQAVVEGLRHAVRGGVRLRAAGAGAKHRPVFTDRAVAALIHLRHGLPRAVLGLLLGVDRSTITRAVAEIRGMLARRGFAVPDRPGSPGWSNARNLWIGSGGHTFPGN